MLLAQRNLLRDRTRFLLSVLGVAVSVGLMLLLSGYRAGVYRQASALIAGTRRRVARVTAHRIRLLSRPLVRPGAGR